MDDADYKYGDQVEVRICGTWREAWFVARDNHGCCCVHCKHDDRLHIANHQYVRRPLPKPLPRLKTVAVEMVKGAPQYVVAVTSNCVNLVSRGGYMRCLEVSSIRRIIRQESNDPDLEARLREAMAQHNQQTKEPEA